MELQLESRQFRFGKLKPKSKLQLNSEEFESQSPNGIEFFLPKAETLGTSSILVLAPRLALVAELLLLLLLCPL